MTLAIKLMRD